MNPTKSDVHMMFIYGATRRHPADREAKAWWSKIGVAFVNRDGSLAPKFEFFPTRLDLTDILIRWPNKDEEGEDPVEGPPPPNAGPMWIIYGLTKRNPEDREEKAFWRKIGVAFVNRDGSFTAKFEYFPTDLEHTSIQIRPKKERADEGQEAAQVAP